jgi:hypothetical protein
LSENSNRKFIMALTSLLKSEIFRIPNSRGPKLSKTPIGASIIEIRQTQLLILITMIVLSRGCWTRIKKESTLFRTHHPQRKITKYRYKSFKTSTRQQPAATLLLRPLTWALKRGGKKN